jgi:gliding motility-associated-like protein
LSAATTSYQYVTGDCPADGFYTVRNSSTNCFGSTWQNLLADHTGDQGYFMLVNASFQPSAFFLDTVRGLCGGTTYEFAAWVMNMLLPSSCSSNGIQPNLTFTIERTDGTVLQTYNTNNIIARNVPTWEQFGFFFATPPNVSDIVLRIYNNSQGGCGNDLALDDITFRPCGPGLTPAITGANGSEINYCEGVPRTFTFTCNVSAGFNNPLFQWQESINGGAWTDIPGATNTSLTRNFAANAAPGKYSYRMSAAEAGNMASAKCRVVSQPLVININANPVTNVISNAPVCEGTTLTMTASGGVQYDWVGPGPFTSSGGNAIMQNAQVSSSGKYYVTVTNAAGCAKLDSVTIEINPGPVAATSFSEASICQGDNITIQGSGGITYEWKPSIGLSSTSIDAPVATPADTTSYQLIVTNGFGCTDTAEVTINVIERPVANAGPDIAIVKNTSVEIPGSATGQNISFSWSPNVFINDILALQPIVTPTHDTTYVLTVMSNEGCGMDEDSVSIFVYQDIYVPTAFTPNGDGLNDTWGVPALSAFEEYTIAIYNRNGELLFRSRNANIQWNGSFHGVPQPPGAYVYMIEIRDIGRLLKGHFMIIR